MQNSKSQRDKRNKRKRNKRRKNKHNEKQSNQEELRPFCKNHAQICAFVCLDESCPLQFVCLDQKCIKFHSQCKQLIGIEWMLQISQRRTQISEEKIIQKFDQMAQHILEHTNAGSDRLLSWIDGLNRQKPQSKVFSQKDIVTCGNEQFKHRLTIMQQQKTRFRQRIYMALSDIEENIDKLYSLQIFNYDSCNYHVLQKTIQMTKLEYETLAKMLFNEKNVVLRDLVLLFDAKQKKFSTSKFHQLCDHASYTLTIIRAENGRLFGGYLYNKWGEYKKSDYNAYLFSVNEAQIINSSQCKNLSDGGLGPCWGQCEHDLHFDLQIKGDEGESDLVYAFKGPKGMSLGGKNTFKIANYIVLKSLW